MKYRTKEQLYELLHYSRDVILSVEDLSVFRPDKTPIIENVGLSIQQGEIVGIIGQSGAGKSTLIKTALNEQELQAQGKILMCGVDVARYRHTITSLFGYVPQELTMIYQNMTAMENLSTFGRQYGMSSNQIHTQATKLLDNLDIKGKQRDKLPVKKLSGGEQRRVSMACGMIHSPELLIMDEPTSGLDPIMRSILWTYIEKLNRAFKTTLIVVTHFPNEGEFCDKLAVFMKPKGFIEYATPHEILQKLPNEGYVVDFMLERYNSDVPFILKTIPSVRYVLMRGERIRVFADTPTDKTVDNIVTKFDSTKNIIVRIEPKNQAMISDYFDIIATEGVLEESIQEQDELEQLLPQDILNQLPNNGDVVEFVLESYNSKVLSLIKSVLGVRYVLMRGERIRVFADTPIDEITPNIVDILVENEIEIHRIMFEQQATRRDYYEIIEGEEKSQ